MSRRIENLNQILISHQIRCISFHDDFFSEKVINFLSFIKKN